MSEVSFISSHTEGDFSSGRLTAWVGRPDERTGQTAYDELWFEVPPDFHTHNDSVAAALMTLVGRRYRAVRFNFPISDFCATTLAAYYGLDEVGPRDPALAPRRPGRRLGLNFSGGLDSMAVWALLREHVGADFRAIAMDYGGPFANERRGFRAVPADVICRTNLRALGYDQHGRFNATGGLLFADYLDLGSLTSGHTYNQSPYSIEHLWHGETPRFRAQEGAYAAGGLTEAHLIRGLNSLGTLKVVVALAPELVEASFAAAAPPGAENHITKGLTLRWLYARLGAEPPPGVRLLVFPDPPPSFGAALGPDMRALFIIKHYGMELARRVMRGLEAHDFAWLDELSLDFLGNYNTNYVELIPADLREGILSGYHACGIYPYTERDWRELDRANDFLLAVTTNPSAREMGELRRRQEAARRTPARS